MDDIDSAVQIKNVLDRLVHIRSLMFQTHSLDLCITLYLLRSFTKESFIINIKGKKSTS